MHPLQVYSTDANFASELHNGNFSNGQNDFSSVPFLQAYSSDVNLLHANIFLPNAKPLYAFHAGELLESTISPAASFDPGMQVLDSQSYSSNENSSLNHVMCPPFPDIVASRVGKMMSIDSTLYSYNLSKVLVEDFAIPRIEHSLSNARGEEVSISRNTKPEKSAEGSVSKKRKSDYSSQVMLQSKSIVVSKEARARRIISDRKRKAKVAEGFKALQNTLPYSDKGSQVTVLGDVIDYIKFLKLRLNVLSQSRLSGEVSAYSFCALRGLWALLASSPFGP
ncbi:hypothetical protein HPP92_025284 [Vanilla planifolia]|uniref:BHLH domain-containing protein n=1 Tax=Vanilla planifolia TaxID=51239 RepID=A0A835U981_VANPL|nr:hypothetical protein HPP92_025284 [Vanilla planifolia]